MCLSQVCLWLNERNAVALDENWWEPTNLQAKLLKHQSFEAEIHANRYRVDTLHKVEVLFTETRVLNFGVKIFWLIFTLLKGSDLVLGFRLEFDWSRPWI